jgi:hypothetical protein
MRALNFVFNRFITSFEKPDQGRWWARQHDDRCGREETASTIRSGVDHQKHLPPTPTVLSYLGLNASATWFRPLAEHPVDIFCRDVCRVARSLVESCSQLGMLRVWKTFSSTFAQRVRSNINPYIIRPASMSSRRINTLAKVDLHPHLSSNTWNLDTELFRIGVSPRFTPNMSNIIPLVSLAVTSCRCHSKISFRWSSTDEITPISCCRLRTLE